MGKGARSERMISILSSTGIDINVLHGKSVHKEKTKKDETMRKIDISMKERKRQENRKYEVGLLQTFIKMSVDLMEINKDNTTMQVLLYMPFCLIILKHFKKYCTEIGKKCTKRR